MRPIATNAAAALAAEHPEVDLSALLNHCTAPYLGVAAVQADVDRLKHEAERKRKLDECQTMSHNALRSELKALGVRNSFDGSTTQCLRSLFCAALQQDNADGCSSSDAVPPQLRRAPELRRHRRQQYDALIEGITLRQLGVCLPDEQWEHYCACGWLKMSLALSKKERRMIALCHRVALCELGVDPTDRATFENAKHVVGYDYTWGWLRAPANSQAQLYLATHPTLYRLYVGLYARLLLGCERYPPGIADEAQAVRCCLELRLQLYNTKIALPKDGGLKFFSHLDCDWRRGGCTATPAPQCLVATSPQHVGSTRVFSARFVDVEAEVRRHELAAAEPVEAPPRKRRRIEPYRLPRARRGACVGAARTEPAGTDFGRATGPEDVQVGDALFFGHLVAHEFTQHATLSEQAAAAAEASTSSLPIGLTRTAEYPTLVAPWIHGEPHQSKDEVLCALLTGTPPAHWAHVYTGNAMEPAAAFFRSALPPLPAVPSTPLARALAGVDAFARCPDAIEWLVRDCRGGREGAPAERPGEREALRLHKRLMLDEMVSGLRRRLRRLAASANAVDLLELSESDAGRATSQRSAFARSAALAVPAAASAAAADPDLRKRPRP